jgi:hypothetical protein
MRRCLRQQFRGGVAEAALIEDEEVEAGEVWCDQGELLPQGRLRQAQRGADGEPTGLDIEEHERAMVTTAGEVEAGNTTPKHRRNISNCLITLHRRSSGTAALVAPSFS